MMWQRFLRNIFSHAAEVTWRGLFASLVVYALVSYLFMLWAGEGDLTSSGNRFFYWLIVTASTVGYGDYSPSTTKGEWLVVLWVIPVGIGLFAATIGKVSALIIDRWQAKLNGEITVSQAHHTVIIGFNNNTRNLIEQIRQERGSHHPVVLVATENEVTKNPLPDKIDFVKIDNYTHRDFVNRANISEADDIIIDIEDDNATNVVCLFCGRAARDDADITATVASEDIAQLIEQLSPNINIIPDLGKEVLVKAAIDPGSEEVIRRLIDIRYGQTQFSVAYEGEKNLEARSIANKLRDQFSATLIAYKLTGSSNPTLNPANDVVIEPGARLYYIASQRIKTEELHRCLDS